MAQDRCATIAALRVAFLSALVLELATALVAVEVGLRLLAGHIGYETALLVLLLTPGGVPAAAECRRAVPRQRRRHGRGRARVRDPRRSRGGGVRRRRACAAGPGQRQQSDDR